LTVALLLPLCWRDFPIFIISFKCKANNSISLQPHPAERKLQEGREQRGYILQNFAACVNVCACCDNARVNTITNC
jgi:hypothetical protein